MIIHVDYIIVGFGLAGLSFTETLIKQNKTFIVFEDDSQKSSIVSGGVYNPVILKRFTSAWNAYDQLQIAIPFYNQIEKRLDIKIDYKFKIKKIFNSKGDEDRWIIALDKPFLSHYINPKICKNKISGIIDGFGFGELKGTGRIDVKNLIISYKNYLKKIGNFIENKFDYNKIEFSNSAIEYKNIRANKIIFCEGFGLKKNPFFNYLPLNGTKGETITIYAPELNIDFLLKSDVFVLPMGNGYYKVGATFNIKDKTSFPTEEGRNELKTKLDKVINIPYTIIDQSAGIRPTVKDRRPLVGIHPIHSQLAVLNGLGTRGVMIAPTVAKNLFNHIENGKELKKEIDIKRFQK